MGDEKEKDQKKQPENPNNSVVNLILESQAEENNNNKGTGGTKRSHVSESSDLDKDIPNLTSKNELIITTSPPLGAWQKVQKKKGKKDKSSLAGNV